MVNLYNNERVNKVCSTLVIISGMAVTSIFVSGNKSMAMEYRSNDSGQVVVSHSKKTNIYKSFTDDKCISFDIPGYSENNNSCMGIQKVVISDDKLENLKRLESIALLKDNWNGNNAKAFEKSLIIKVKNIITFLEIQPEVFPTACGTLQLEYDKEDGSHMEIELSESENAEVFCVDKLGYERTIDISADYEKINRVVADFYE